MPTPSNTCCPTPSDSFGTRTLTYINPDGTLWNYYVNAEQVLLAYSYTAPDGTVYTKEQAYGNCITVQSVAAGYGPIYAPIPCPCCPDGSNYEQWLTYNSVSTQAPCVDKMGNNYPVIPCLECVCPVPPPPPQCETCVNLAHTVSFNFNDTVTRCKECSTDDHPLPIGNKVYDNFLTYKQVDPIIIFKYRQ